MTEKVSPQASSKRDQFEIKDEQQEKSWLISQVLELQQTLNDLSQRVEEIKDENIHIKFENQLLGQYIENLMSTFSMYVVKIT